MPATLSVFLASPKSKDSITLDSQAKADGVALASLEGREFARMLFSGSSAIHLLTNGQKADLRGAFAPINKALATMIRKRSSEAAVLLHNAVDGPISIDDGAHLFEPSNNAAFEIVGDLIAIRKLLATHVLGPKQTKKAVLVLIE